MRIFEISGIEVISDEDWVYKGVDIHIDSFHFKGFCYLSEKNRISRSVVSEGLLKASCKILHFLKVILVIIRV